MKKSKWFEIDNTFLSFSSIQKAKTLKQAFEQVIEKWELIVEGYQPDCDVDTCGLCDLFHSFKNPEIEDNCIKCPIFKKTKEDYCKKTPYESWYKSNSMTIAQKELAFLKRLQKGREVI